MPTRTGHECMHHSKIDRLVAHVNVDCSLTVMRAYVLDLRDGLQCDLGMSMIDRW